MPKEKEVTNHPCHLLSLPSAKRFWCRHCMTVFEDAITRWRHSRSCRYGVVNNFMRRRELEAKALQNTTVLNPVEARLEQSIQMCDLASTSAASEADPNSQSQVLSGPESFNCFICHQKFASMEEMRLHVKYPCSNSKIITSHVPHPKHSVPVFIDALPGQAHHWQPQPHQEVHQASAYIPQQTHTQTSYGIEIQTQQEMESQYDSTPVSFNHSGSSNSDGITPTNIYVNEQGETVIEVENLDLNSEGAELSLAHLLTQLSQQGIVFDKSRTAGLQRAHVAGASSSSTMYTSDTNTQHSAQEEEEQPTAEDAANTLAQLAGLRGFSRTNQVKPMEETQIHSQVPSVQNYSYNSPLPGTSGHYTISSQPQIDVQYEYGYSETPPAGGHTIVTSQQVALQHTITTSPQEYENITVEHEAVEDAIGFYSDSPNVTYITDSDSQQQIHVEREATSSNEYSKHCVGNGAVLVQHYPVQTDGSEHIGNDPIELSPKAINETQGAMLSEEVGVDESDIKLSDNQITNTLDTSFEDNMPSHTPQIKEVVIKTELESGIMNSQIKAQDDEYTARTVSLQDIVDPENYTLKFEEQTQSRNQNASYIIPAPSIHSVSSEPASLTEATPSLGCQATQDVDISQVDSTAVTEIEETVAVTEGETTAAYPATLYIVTPTGILPVSSQKT